MRIWYNLPTHIHLILWSCYKCCSLKKALEKMGHDIM